MSESGALQEEDREAGRTETQPAGATLGHTCMNCGAVLAGPYCHACGQKDDDIRRPVWTFLLQFLENTFAADSRSLNTLLLLIVMPGGLTRRFMAGHRARFVPPVRLYVLVSILFFLVLSIANVAILDIAIEPKAPVPSTSGTMPEHIPGTRAEAEAAPQVPGAVPAEQPDQAQPGREGVVPLEVDQQGGDTAVPGTSVPVSSERGTSPGILNDILTRNEDGSLSLSLDIETEGTVTPEDIRQRLLDELAASDGLTAEERAEIEAFVNTDLPPVLDTAVLAAAKADKGDTVGLLDGFPYDINVGMFVRLTDETRQGLSQEDIDAVLLDPDISDYVKEATRGFTRALKEPQRFNDLFNKWLPRALFVLVPFFALILRLFHWGGKRYYVNQLIFSLHFHSFLFLLMTAMVLIIPAYGGELGIQLFWWGTSLYLIIALKVGQQQGWVRAFVKAGFIWMAYFSVMMTVLGYAVVEGLREL
ncbi:DUF3667 domain-containing protein [Eilatimonas milleporae]|uniref:Uncharacterized protein DUF3667 n=1 Tax=Eilatimonas milleporae TaxID=911205 RepID=A0A3M0CQH0_9PROT|nr:DUF3667 domain-containing protein [Eilatimonas milleporae]RMB11794.1 uncharacterized protein DUF3667 [Eilatimonas milleporae]